MSFIKKEYKQLLIILVLFLSGLFLYTGKMINPYIDFGDEISYPVSILKNSALYKDLYVPFGPLSYLFNAFWLKFFSVNLTTYYFIGSLNAFVILNLLYGISRFFLDKTFSLLIVLYVMGNCVFVPHVMNYITPYSYSIVYGLSSCFLSVLMFLNYLKTDKNLFLSVSCLFAGVAAVCKYEFCLYSVLLLIFIFYKSYKHSKFTVFLKNASVCFCTFISIPFLTFAGLFYRGLTFADLQGYFINLKTFAGSQQLADLYKGSFYFSADIFLIMLSITFLAFVLAMLAYKIVKVFSSQNSVKISWAGYIFVFALLLFIGFKFNIFYIYIFALLPIIVTILYIFKIGKINRNLSSAFLVISAIGISIKSYWSLNMFLYGRYFLPLLLIAFFVLIFFYIRQNRLLRKTLVIFMLALCVSSPIMNSGILKNISFKVNSDNGAFMADEKDAYIFNKIIEYFETENAQNKTIAALPVNGLINFVTGTDFIFSAGCDTVDFFEKTKPDYVVVIRNKQNEHLFLPRTIKTLEWVNFNYKTDTAFQKGDNQVLIFKKI